MLIRVLSFLLTIQSGFAQRGNSTYEPLKAYDFSDSGYALVFVSRGLRNETSVHYLEDSASLIQLQQAWKFDKEAVTYPFACNDGYHVLLMKKGEVVDRFSIKIRCQAFVSDQGWYHFPVFSPDLLIEARSTVARDSTFADLLKGRRAIDQIRQRPDMDLLDGYDWEHFEGFFHFRYPNPNRSGKAPFTSWEDITAKVEKDIKTAYPHEHLKVELLSYGYGVNYPNLTYKLISNRSLFNRFELYSRTQAGWKDFEPRLTYFKKQ